MSDLPARLENWLHAEEDEHLEFKAARNRFDFEELVRYCCALANEGGGTMVLGVTDKRPRTVIGSNAFRELQRTKLGLLERLRLRIDADELQHENGRVLVFSVPSRPIGTPVDYNGAYWMRGGESLVPMTPDQLKRILDEAHPDYSAQVCPDASTGDLDMDAIAQFRRRWATKARRPDIEALPIEQLLADAELLLDGELTYAALVLLGSHRGLGRLLGQCEVVYEYRAEDASIAPQFRREFRNGFFLFQDSLWELIDARNNRYSYQEGLFRYDLPAFNEEAVREALLNAVSHRDYRLPGSIFVRQYPTRLEIVSPGGFPPGVTADNIIYKQSPRNRRIAEALARCGLVERSGQGADRMFSTAIREGKLPPDFDGTDAHQVAVTLHGAVQDGAFLVFLERLASEQAHNLHIKDLLLLDAIHRQLPISSHLRAHVEPLLELGAIERVGRGRGVRYLLSRRFYQTVGKQGAYTRKRGLDRETNKALLLKHIERRRTEGCQLSELQEVLPSLSKWQVQTLLREMKQAGVVHSVGHTRAGRWFPGPAQEP